MLVGIGEERRHQVKEQSDAVTAVFAMVLVAVVVAVLFF